MKFYMAPLQSYTTCFYRLAHAQTYGAMQKYITPFFEDTGKGLNEIKLEPELNAIYNSELNIVPQVACNNGDFLNDFATKVEKMGFSEINLNMGCPFPMLVKRQKGGGLLAHPDMIQHMLDHFFNSNTSLKLSIKMRLGVDSFDEGQQIIKLLNNYPLEEIIIHPRLVIDKYNGHPNWQQFKIAEQNSHHPIVANGDINNEDDFNHLTQHFPHIKSIMLGRGLLTNPNLTNRLQDNQLNNNERSIHKLHTNYYRIITNHFKDWNQAFNYLQTFWHYPLNASSDQKRLLRKLKKHNKPELYNQWLKQAIGTFEK